MNVKKEAARALQNIDQLYSSEERADMHVQAIINLLQSENELNRSLQDQAYFHYLQFKAELFS